MSPVERGVLRVESSQQKHIQDKNHSSQQGMSFLLKAKVQVGLAIASSIAALLVIIIIGWSWKSLHDIALQSTMSMNIFELKLVEEQKNTQQLQNQIILMQQKIQQQQATLDNTDTNLQTVLQNQGKGTSAYTLSEIKYLISLANLHLRFNRDIATAIVLLQTADDRTSQLTDPTLLDLRQALANDMTALKTIPVIDREGILTRLTALQQQITQLPLAIAAASEPSSVDSTTKDKVKGWKKPLREMGDAFKQLIIVRHRDPMLDQLIAPDQEFYLREYINLLFEQARWAVLQGDVAVYISSLQQAKMWLNRYFAGNPQAMQQMLAMLNDLQVTPINTNLPELTRSLLAIDQAIKQHYISINPSRSSAATTANLPVSSAKNQGGN